MMDVSNDMQIQNALSPSKPSIQPSVTKTESPEAAAENILISTGEVTLTLEGGEIAVKEEATSLLADVLKLAGFKATPENIKMMEIMIQNNLPVHKESLAKFNQALKLTGNDFAKALFMLQNDMKLNTSNATAIEKYIRQETKLLSQIEELAAAIDQIPNEKLRNSVVSKLVGEAETEKPFLLTQTEKAHIKQTKETVATAEMTKQALAELATQEAGAAEIPKEIIKMEAHKAETNKPEITKPDLKSTLTELKASLLPEALTEIKEAITRSDFSIKDLEDILQKASGEKLPPFNTLDKETLHKLIAFVFEKETDIKEKLHTLLENTPAKNKLLQKFILEKESPEKIDRLLTGLKEGLASAKAVLEKNDALSPRLNEVIENINKNTDFLGQIKNSTFIQLPITINNSETTAELFVFKDKRQKKLSNASSSALLSLNLKNLGIFEAYIQKTNNSVMCQFRTQREVVEQLIRANVGALERLLRQRGYSLNSAAYKKVNEPFTLVDKEPKFTDLEPTTGKVKIGLDAKA